MRFTKIVATLGPSTNSPEKIEELATLGINVCRMNFSHGDHEFHGQTMKNVRAVNKKGYVLALMLDTKGPEVRTGDVSEPLLISKGDLVTFTPRDITGKEKGKTVKVSYDKFAHDAKNARCIVIDNGAIEMKLIKIENDLVIAKALESGKITSRRHVNLPGAFISLPSFTDKDWKDIKFGIEQDVDFIAPSFVRTEEDIQELKAFLKKNKSAAHIIAKIETPQAVDNIDAIIEASDGIMVARGDLGSEVPFEDVPGIQEAIVQKCRKAGKPVIVATHMLESMISSPTPTRAEVTDIAYAAKLQTDSTMLSGETAGGLYPMKAVAAMDKVLRKCERIEPSYDLLIDAPDDDAKDIDLPRKEQALSACVLGTKLHADALIVISKHGRTAMAISNCRPLIPIHAFTETEDSMRRLVLVWGVLSHCIKFSKNPDQTIADAIALGKKEGFLKKGQRVVAVSDIRSDDDRVMTIQIRTIG